MNREDIFLAVSELRPELILEAETAGPKQHGTVRFLRWGAAAAAIVLIAVAVFALPRLRDKGRPQPGGVPGTEVYWTEPPQSAAGDPQPVGVPGPDALLPEAANPVVIAWNELDEERGRLGADMAGVLMVSEPLTAAQLAALGGEETVTAGLRPVHLRLADTGAAAAPKRRIAARASRRVLPELPTSRISEPGVRC